MGSSKTRCEFTLPLPLSPWLRYLAGPNSTVRHYANHRSPRRGENCLEVRGAGVCTPIFSPLNRSAASLRGTKQCFSHSLVFVQTCSFPLLPVFLNFPFLFEVERERSRETPSLLLFESIGCLSKSVSFSPPTPSLYPQVPTPHSFRPLLPASTLRTASRKPVELAVRESFGP